MMMLMLAAAAALSPAVPDNIDVAEANWDSYPRLVTEHLAIPNGEMVGRVQRLMQRDVCEFEGQSGRRFNIDVNYAVTLDPQGNATRILVEDVGCRPLELMVGRIAADIVSRGFVRMAPPAQETIFANRINFNLR
jgi:hypothetical protein